MRIRIEPSGWTRPLKMHPDHTEAKKMVPRSGKHCGGWNTRLHMGCRKYSNGHAPVPQDSQDYVYTKQSPKYLILTCLVDFSALRAGRSLWSLLASECLERYHVTLD